MGWGRQARGKESRACRDCEVRNWLGGFKEPEKVTDVNVKMRLRVAEAQ